MTRALLLTLAALAGCGGGAGADPFSPAPASCTPRPVTVTLIGDSTMYGIDGFTSERADQDPGELLQAAMDKRFGADAVYVTNHAVPGQSAPQAPLVRADVVVENYGINDMRLESVAEYAAALGQLGATLVVTQSPVKREPLDVQAQYVDAAMRLGLPVADVFGYVQSLPDWPALIGSDNVHPSAYLYTLIVRDVLAPAVVEQVAPLRCEGV